jgi:outer membrane receptor protein involved in Fe transport
LIAQPISGQANATGGGNLDLDPEKSTSWTVGAVFQPDFVPGLSLSIDYYNIKITGAITTPTPDDAITACFGPASAGTVPSYNPSAGASGTNACQVIGRDPLTGGLNGDPATTSGLFLSLSNLGTIETSGVDFTVNYRRDLGFAGLDINGVLNWQDENLFQAAPGGLNRECVGFYSANCGQPIFEWQWSLRTTFSFDDIDISLLWRHLDNVIYEPGIGNLFSGTLGASAGPVAGQVEDFNTIGSYDYFDLTGRFAVDDHLTITLAVQNLFDKTPPLVGGEAGSTSFNSGNTFPSTYDALGRRFAIGANVRF